MGSPMICQRPNTKPIFCALVAGLVFFLAVESSGRAAEISTIFPEFVAERTASPTGFYQTLLAPTLAADITDLAQTAPKSTDELFVQTADSFAFSRDLTVRGAMGLDSFSVFQVWGNFYTARGRIRPRDVEETFENRLTGGMVGLNIGWSRNLFFTGYYNYNDGSLRPTDWNHATTTHLGGLGVQYKTQMFYFSLLGNYGRDRHGLSYNGPFSAGENPGNPDLNGDAPSLDYKGWQGNGFFETGFVFPTAGGLFVLRPFSNLQYSHLEHDRFDRSAMALTGSMESYNALYQSLGSRVDLNLGLLESMSFQGRIAWVHQYLKEAAPIQNFQFSRIAGTITPTQVYYEGNAGRDWFWGGAGLKCSLFGHFLVTADYDVLVNQYETTHFLSAGLVLSF